MQDALGRNSSESNTPGVNSSKGSDRRVSGLFTPLERQIKSPPPVFSGKTKSNPAPYDYSNKDSSSLPREVSNPVKKRQSLFS